ncbi:hypothetical protein CKO14_12445 [Halorhodospira halophila]|nr:hypothetical protein [Halorhodospira halophila]
MKEVAQFVTEDLVLLDLWKRTGEYLEHYGCASEEEDEPPDCPENGTLTLADQTLTYEQSRFHSWQSELGDEYVERDGTIRASSIGPVDEGPSDSEGYFEVEYTDRFFDGGGNQLPGELEVEGDYSRSYRDTTSVPRVITVDSGLTGRWHEDDELFEIRWDSDFTWEQETINPYRMRISGGFGWYLEDDGEKVYGYDEGYAEVSTEVDLKFDQWNWSAFEDEAHGWICDGEIRVKHPDGYDLRIKYRNDGATVTDIEGGGSIHLEWDELRWEGS